ncbi:MAG TPA: tryptophan synthase subunit beta, partial [Blastocatellia bacterium]|nr:tryptophan synthase subunit beta [Blastocatellia bacterium]
MEKNGSGLPDLDGHFGSYGGSFVPETLMHPLAELKAAYAEARADESFQREFETLLREYVGRPTPITFAGRLTEHLGGA